MSDPKYTEPGEHPELIAAQERAERAERELEEFRTRVRDAVIDEAESRDWCDQVDRWLDDLGLPGRYGDLPREQNAVVLLTDGRVAVRHDDDDEPWRIYDPQAEVTTRDGNVWLTDRDIAQHFARILPPVSLSTRYRTSA